MADSPKRPGLSARVRQGDVAAIARLLTRVENDDAVGREALELLLPQTGSAHLVGVTGPPGGGKSTLVNELIRAYRAQGRKVAVLAIDPSSPLTGGATLGDRIRMTEWHADPNVFIRSMASRRHGGGLALNTLAAASVFDAAGFDPVIIETVGTGQDEVAIAELAHTTLLVQVPGMGDSVQTLKAGALEIGDVVVITKADRPEANELARDLRRLQTLTFGDAPTAGGWLAPVVKTSALDHQGIDDLMTAIANHRRWLDESGELEVRRRKIAASQLAARIQHDLMDQVTRPTQHGLFATMVDEIMARAITPQRASQLLLALLAHERGGD
jgi:LAO/AO transport system kinase